MKKINMHEVTIAQLREARDWILDNSWADLDDDAIAELTGEQIVKGVQRHYEGGWSAFLRNTALVTADSQYASVVAVLKTHDGHSVHVGGAWSTVIKTVDASKPAEELAWQYAGFSVHCTTCDASLSQQWNV